MRGEDKAIVAPENSAKMNSKAKDLVTLFLAAALGVITWGVVPSSAQTPPPCPTLVASNTTLTSDCVGPIVVVASGVELNLGGNTVFCLGGGLPGIDITDQSAVRVTNGTVTNCGAGILVTRGAGHIFDTNLNLISNSVGIGFLSTNGSHLRSITIKAFCVGVGMIGSSLNMLDSMTISGPPSCDARIPPTGVVFGSSPSTVCHFVRNCPVGLPTTLNSTNNVITSSAISDNAGGGVLVALSSDSNTIQSSTLNNNGTGVEIGSNSNVVHANTVDMNSNVGIHVDAGATGNSITSNEALNNIGFDLEDDNFIPPCDSNIWAQNRFTTANQSCIH
jgi:Right handed beta helix region